MSSYTTKEITRAEAISQILEEQARRVAVVELSNDELEDLMCEYFGKARLENYIVRN